MRHLKRNHGTETEVANIFQHPKYSKERKHALSLFRNDTNFTFYIEGIIKPKRQVNNFPSAEDNKYYPCAYCKGVYIKGYLRRHVKRCTAFKMHAEINQKANHLSRSQTVTACAIDPTNVISKLNVKEQVKFF